jgi:hypothetical protein
MQFVKLLFFFIKNLTMFCSSFFPELLKGLEFSKKNHRNVLTVFLKLRIGMETFQGLRVNNKALRAHIKASEAALELRLYCFLRVDQVEKLWR